MGSHRILRAITRLNIGGPARQALMLTRDLEPEYNTVLVTGTPEPGEGELIDPLVTPKRIPLGRSISPTTDYKAYRELRELVAEGDFDIVHTHMAKAGTLGRLAAARASEKPKIVHTFHGHVLEGYFSKPVEKAFIQVEKRLARRTDALVAVSEEIRDQLLELGIGDPARWRVIPLGFDLGPLLSVTEPSGRLREQLGIGSDTPLVGVLGRLAPIKDHSTLLKAIARLPDVHLAILGDGELREAIVSEAESLAISDRVHLVGWWLDVASAISDMDVVALTSRNEGTPVSLIEAHACARPAVATDVGGVRTVVVNGETGSLVSPQDPVAVAGELDRILKDRSLATSMGLKGREHVRDRFDKRRLIADIRTLYQDLLTS